VKLEVRHVFPCSQEVFWQMFWDEDYDRMLKASAGVSRETLWDREEGPERRWRMRFTPHQELPTLVASAIGTNKLIYEQESRLDANRKLHWEVFPAVAGDKVSARGTMTATSTGTGVERRVEGEVTVRIPLIGGRIEKSIHQSVLESYEKAYEVSLRWLEERGLRA
jgi:hypothetical protein